MLLKIDDTNVTSMVHIDGLAWSESDIHSEDSGRDMAGTMHVTVVGTKVTLSINCSALSQTNATALLAAVKSAPPLSVTYDDPVTGNSKTINCYCGDRNCEFLKECSGVKWWRNIKFDLIEC